MVKNTRVGQDDSILNGGYALGTMEGDEPSPRGEIHTAVFYNFTRVFLRLGLFFQFLAILGMMIGHLAHGGRGLFVHDMYAGTDDMRNSSKYHATMVVFCIMHLFGALFLGLFQVFIPDNSKFSRGFRAGSKLFGRAVLLDILSNGMRLVLYIYGTRFISLRWWAKYHPTGSDWSVYHIGNLLNSFSLLLYGLAIFYLEAYHDEGTYEEYGWLTLVLFTLSGYAEFTMVFTNVGMFFTILLLLAYFMALLWASNFEMVLDKTAQPLHSRNLNSDIAPHVSYESQSYYKAYDENVAN